VKKISRGKAWEQMISFHARGRMGNELVSEYIDHCGRGPQRLGWHWHY